MVYRGVTAGGWVEDSASVLYERYLTHISQMKSQLLLLTNYDDRDYDDGANHNGANHFFGTACPFIMGLRSVGPT